MLREIAENVLSGTNAGFKTALTIIFNNLNRRIIMPINNLISKMQSLLLTLILMVAAFGVSSAVAAEKKTVTDPSTGKVVTAPEYGGTLIVSKSGVFPPTADPYFSTSWALHSVLHGVLESLSIGNWAIDRDEFDWSSYADPLFGKRGALAESWDISEDGLTYTIHIRQGVHWHDKPPVFGREMTADDVEYTFHRNLGNRLTGTEFSEAELSPGVLRWDGWDTMPIESITATDKWTVVFKLTRPDPRALRGIISP